MDYNDFIWNRLLDRKKVDKKLRNGFRFHHEIATDGVCVSILYSRPDPSGKGRVTKTRKRLYSLQSANLHKKLFLPRKRLYSLQSTNLRKQKLFHPLITIRYLKTTLVLILGRKMLLL